MLGFQVLFDAAGLGQPRIDGSQSRRQLIPGTDRRRMLLRQTGQQIFELPLTNERDTRQIFVLLSEFLPRPSPPEPDLGAMFVQFGPESLFCIACRIDTPRGSRQPL